ncbi:hypothetical protein T440DRAFT_290492 [Plenodomus tracheiphilus IPT5]|uniref:Uncharacterized protein n=1 Tax=Plenodomus tracheiphilus IPT5 TaxID=1408161 RepID=A0A6A7BEA4_9PLEO|nr:hypothetical protein T440DRAFT_290492 [Plenodomus tracheiphilus IPT5]
MSVMSLLTFMFILSSAFYFVFGQVKLAMVLIVATFETLEDMYEDLDLYVRYNIYDIYCDFHEFWAAQIQVIKDAKHHNSTHAVIFLILLVLLYACFFCSQEPTEEEEKIETPTANGNILLTDPEDLVATKALADAPAPPFTPPAPLAPYTSPAFTYEHFNGTGDPFQPHRQPELKKNKKAPYNFLKDTFLDEEVEAKYGFTREYDQWKGPYWVYKAPMADKRPSITTMMEVLVEPQPVAQAALQPQDDIVAATPAQEVAAPIMVAPPPPPAPIMAPTMVSVLRAEAYQPPPSPPPSVEMVCDTLARNTSGLRNAITDFLTVVNSSGDPSRLMLLVATSFDTAFQALWVHRTQLTLDESLQTGWPGLLEEFYAVVHPNAYWLVTQYGGDMLVFLQGVLAFGRYLGAPGPDIDLSTPRAPTPPPVARAEMPQVYQAVAPPPPAAPSAPSSPPGLAAVPAPAPAPPTFSSSGIKPTSSRALSGASRPPRSAVQRRTVGARHQATPQASHQLSSQPAKKMLDFYNLAAWKDVDQEGLAGLTVESFGWSDDKATSKLLWTFTTGQQLDLGGSWTNGFTAEYIVNEIDSKVGALKRAAWVLLWQAQAPFNWKAESQTAPTLLAEMTTFLRDAGQKVDFAAAREPLRNADDFMVSFRFHHNHLGRHPALRGALALQYNDADVGEWYRMVREVKEKVTSK